MELRGLSANKLRSSSALEMPWKTPQPLPRLLESLPFAVQYPQIPCSTPSSSDEGREQENFQRLQARERWSHVGCCPGWQPGLTEGEGAESSPKSCCLQRNRYGRHQLLLLPWGGWGFAGCRVPQHSHGLRRRFPAHKSQSNQEISCAGFVPLLLQAACLAA